MSVRSGQSITKVFTTRVFSTGVATNADSLPTGTLYVNGTADAASVTVTNVATGIYKAAVTLPTLAVGDVVDLRIAATVSSVADTEVIWSDTKDIVIDASGLADATAVKLGPSGSATAQTARDLGANIDAAISTRSTYAGADTAGTTTLLSRLTSTRATLLDNLDAAITTRMATFTYTTPPTAAAIVTAIMTDLLSGTDFNTVGSFGKLIKDYLDAAVSTRLAASGYTAPDNTTIGTIFTNIGANGAGLTAIGDTRLGNLDAAVSTRLATTGYTAAPTAAQNRIEMDTNSTKLAHLDADVSSRLATVGYTAPDNASASSAASSAATAATQATNAASQTTAANIRTAVGLAAANLDTQLGAILDASGSGASLVTITVNDGSTVIQNARVTMVINSSVYSATTSSSGVATLSPNEGNGTYSVRLTATGYQFTPTTLVVSGDTSHTYSMSSNSVSPPSNPSLSAIEVLCVDSSGDPEDGVSVVIRMIGIPSGSQNIAFRGSSQTAVSAADGIARFEVVQSGTYEWKRGLADVWQEVTIDADGVTNVTSVIGSP